MNNKNIEIDVGNVPANRKGKRRPYFDLKLSDIDPIIGSVMASNTVATAVANQLRLEKCQEPDYKRKETQPGHNAKTPNRELT